MVKSCLDNTTSIDFSRFKHRENSAKALMTPQLRAFIDVCTATVAATPTPADSVERLAAPMLGLVGAAESLEPRDRRSGDDGYSRNLIYAAADDMSSTRSSGVRVVDADSRSRFLGGRRRGGGVLEERTCPCG